MKLLLRRNQARSRFGLPIFKLWAKLEFEADEAELIKRYKFADARLVRADQPNLIRNTALVGVAGLLFGWYLFNGLGGFGNFLALIAGGGGAWFFYDRTRETVYVNDLIHGRYFDCNSVIELARKEAWLGIINGYLRQVMETAKFWDGTETVPIEALSKEEAKLVVIRGL